MISLPAITSIPHSTFTLLPFTLVLLLLLRLLLIIITTFLLVSILHISLLTCISALILEISLDEFFNRPSARISI